MGISKEKMLGIGASAIFLVDNEILNGKDETNGGFRLFHSNASKLQVLMSLPSVWFFCYNIMVYFVSIKNSLICSISAVLKLV